jgi:beta-lactamase regulating signal transducer with metallopeptidase domain
MTINITAVWDALGWAILHSLWQGALIGFIVWTVRALATERRAWLRYLVGMGGLIATFAAFFATFVLLVFSRLQNQPSVEFAGPDGAGSASDLMLSISVLPVQMSQANIAEMLVPWLGMIWAVGFTFLSLQAYRAYATTRWLATRGLRSPGADWTSRFSALIKRSRTHERVRLFVSEHVSGPMTLGALRPIVLVPIGFLTAMPSAQVEAILLHELAHIRRHDFLLGLIQTAIRTVLYFNPAVIMISRQIDEDREQACDDIAVSVSGNPTDLVRGLAALRLGTRAPALAMAADGGPLLTRLNRLMGRPAARTRSASSRLSAAAASALLLGTAAISTVSMAHPHPPAAPEAPEAPEMLIPDTVVRAQPPERPSPTPQPIAPEQPRIYAANMATLPPMPAMPEMPAIPETPALPAVPTPVFGDYDSVEDFETAMEAWGETMEVWGEEVERRFEGDWEDRMDAWGEEMEVWGEAVEELAEDFDGNGFEILAELDGLAGLSELAALADLSALENGVFVLDDDRVDAKAEEIRASILTQIETRMRDGERAEEEAERAQERAERAQERIEEQVERERELVQDRMERAQDRAQNHAERVREREERRTALHAERDRRTAEQHARSRSQSSSETRSYQTTEVSGAGHDDTVRINGHDIHIGRLRQTLMDALVEDGFVNANARKVKLSLCGGVTVNGREGTDAQYRRYKTLFADMGLDVSGSITIKLKPDSLYLSLSGSSDHDDGLEMTFGTYEHTSNE